MGNRPLETILRRIHASDIAKPGELQGCSEVEIETLETKYNVSLPRSYRDYLEAMGHQSGRLFTSDHVSVCYTSVLDLTSAFHQDRLRSQPADNCLSFNPLPPESFQLPKYSLLIAERLAEQWQFIQCQGQEDTPVWYFNENDWEITRSHDSVWQWLEFWCGTAEDAIASGYFA